MQSRTYNLCAKFVLLSVMTKIIYSNIQIPQINFTSSKIYQEKIKEFINNIMEYPRTRFDFERSFNISLFGKYGKHSYFKNISSFICSFYELGKKRTGSNLLFLYIKVE